VLGRKGLDVAFSTGSFASLLALSVKTLCESAWTSVVCCTSIFFERMISMAA
jgi:hypothetical protein